MGGICLGAYELKLLIVVVGCYRIFFFFFCIKLLSNIFCSQIFSQSELKNQIAANKSIPRKVCGLFIFVFGFDGSTELVLL